MSNVLETKVYFWKLEQEEIEKYVHSGEPMDKAGSYALQGFGALFIEKIDGDFFTVMGLPISSVAQSLKEFEVV